MDIDAILNELRNERDQLEEAIIAIERLQLGGRPRGRPPAWVQAARSATQVNHSHPSRRRGRPPGSKNKAKAA
jgi:hypothetical protein